MKNFIIITSLIVLSFLPQPINIDDINVVEEEEPPLREEVQEEITIKQRVLNAFPEHPEMVKVAKCESGLKQFNLNGSVIRGVENPRDVGLFQINEHYWLAEAQKLGINIYSLEGNIEMAKVILEQQGISAWHWSSHCHHQK